jgi:hypothetical protein
MSSAELRDLYKLGSKLAVRLLKRGGTMDRLRIEAFAAPQNEEALPA